MDSTKRILDFTPTRKKIRAEMANQAIAGIVLLLDGIDIATNDGTLLQPRQALDFLAGCAILFAIAVEIRHQNKGSHSINSWVTTFGGIALFVQGVNIHHPGKVFQPGLLYILLGVITTLRGIFHTKIPAVRRIIADENGFFIRTSPFHHSSFGWNEVAALHDSAPDIIVKLRDGSEKILRLKNVGNRDEVRSLLHSYFNRKGPVV